MSGKRAKYFRKMALQLSNSGNSKNMYGEWIEGSFMNIYRRLKKAFNAGKTFKEIVYKGQ
jgi:hypothetical protein